MDSFILHNRPAEVRSVFMGTELIFCSSHGRLLEESDISDRRPAARDLLLTVFDHLSSLIMEAMRRSAPPVHLCH